MNAEDIGTLRDYFQVDNEVRRNMLDALDGLREAGCQVDEVKLGWTEEAYDAWYREWDARLRGPKGARRCSLATASCGLHTRRPGHRHQGDHGS